MKSNILWQDNEGAERMAKNGKLSCSSKSRHIAIKLFWITDRVKQGKLDVRHCSTDIMLANFFTKTLQGKKFHMFRRVIMGWDHVDVLKACIEGDDGSSMKERVGNNVNRASNVKTLIGEPPGNNIGETSDNNIGETSDKLSWAQIVKG